MTPGQHLRQKRTELGRSLDQVSTATKIHLKILSAIEEDRYADLPARAFTRGFLVNYAKSLKLEPEAFLKEHHEFLEQKYHDRTTRDEGHRGYAFEGKELEQNRRWMWIGLSVLGTFVLAVVFIFKPSNSRHKEKHKELAAESAALTEPTPTPPLSEISSVNPPLLAPASSSTQSTPALLPNPQLTPTPAQALAVASPSPTPSTDRPSDKLNKGDDLSPEEAKLKITLQTEGDTWIRYKADGKPSSVLILRAGKMIVIKAKDRILFESSPSAVFQYRLQKGANQPLPFHRFEMNSKGELNAYEGAELGKKPLSDTTPPPRAQ